MFCGLECVACCLSCISLCGTRELNKCTIYSIDFFYFVSFLVVSHVPCRVESFRVVSCPVVLFHVEFRCYVVSCHVVQWGVVRCCVVLSRVDDLISCRIVRVLSCRA